MNHKEFELYDSKNQLIFKGTSDQVREEIEDLLEKEFGFFISLQENINEDDDGLDIYLHSDIYDDLTDVELKILLENDINYSNEKITKKAIMKKISVKW